MRVVVLCHTAKPTMPCWPHGACGPCSAGDGRHLVGQQGCGAAHIMATLQVEPAGGHDQQAATGAHMLHEQQSGNVSTNGLCAAAHVGSKALLRA